MYLPGLGKCVRTCICHYGTTQEVSLPEKSPVLSLLILAQPLSLLCLLLSLVFPCPELDLIHLNTPTQSGVQEQTLFCFVQRVRDG